MSFHGNLTVSDGIHLQFAWIVADTTARDALVVTADDILKAAWVESENAGYVLTDLTPTWVVVGGVSALNDLSDVNTAGVTDGQAILYDSGSGDWIPGDVGSDEHIIEDAVTAAVTDVVTLGHNSTGTPLAGFGTGIAVQAETNTTPDTVIGGLSWSWDDPTHASRRSNVVISNVTNGGSLIDVGVLQSGSAVSVVGNTRGLGAVDFQITRAAATQVASGFYSSIFGGRNNTASGDSALALNGWGNAVGGSYTTALNGRNNTLTGDYNSILGGHDSTITGGNGNLLGTPANSSITTGLYSVILSGYNNSLTGNRYNNIGTGTYNSIVGNRFNMVGNGHTNTITNAAARYNFIGTGKTNTLSSAAYHNVIVGGLTQTISGGGFGFIGGGQSNSISSTGDNNVIGGGFTNVIDTFSIHSTINGGRLNTISASGALIAGGQNNTISSAGSFGVIMGGVQNSVTAAYGIVMGANGSASLRGQVVSSGDIFTSLGDAQGSIQLLANNQITHSTAAWGELFLDGTAATERIVLPTDQIMTFDILIVGSTAGATDNFSYRIEGACKNDGGTSTLLASTVTTIYETTATFDARVTVDDATDTLRIEVQDSAGGGSVVRWVSTIRTCELIYA